ncbi:MAG: amino acid permease [Bacteroidia bacterium]|nr:amino acid permease [Bacteroidia bacterium]MDW8347567.1 amino acid permease [Bacteroidia bacterium]
MANTFKKEIRLYDAVMLVAGTMIGSGIYLVTADIARSVQSAGYILLVWLISGIITLLGALNYGELTSMMPQTGGQYVFLQKAYNNMIAFLYGWTLFMVIQTGTIAAVAIGFAKFTGVFIPSLSEVWLIIIKVKITYQQVLAVLTIILLTYINTRGVKYGKYIQNILGSTKIVALIVLVLIGFFVANFQTLKLNFEHAWAFRSPNYSLSVAIGMGLVGALFSSDAWNNISFAGDEVVNPQRTIRVGLILGVCLVVILYLLVNVVYLSILPISVIQNALEDRVAILAAMQTGGPYLVYLLAILIMVSTFSCLNGCILAGARVYYQMAKDGLFFTSAGHLNAQGVPATSLWYQGIWASVLCFSGTYSNLLNYVMLAVIVFYILTITGIFLLRVKEPNAERPYKVPFYPVLPLLYVILTTIFIILLLMSNSQYALSSLIIVCLGIPVFFVFQKMKLKKVK